MNDHASSAHLRIICAGGFRAAMEGIASAYESSGGGKIQLTFGTPAKTRELVTAGEGFDLVVVTAGSLDEGASARLDPATRFTVARSPVGMGLRAGLEKRAIGELADFIALIESLDSVCRIPRPERISAQTSSPMRSGSALPTFCATR